MRHDPKAQLEICRFSKYLSLVIGAKIALGLAQKRSDSQSLENEVANRNDKRGFE
jgi:hypothetical protein